jgi:signal transduction histidine kinase
MKLHFSLSLRAGLLLTYLVLIAVSLGLLAWRIGSSLDASRFSETMRDQEGRAILAASATSEWLGNYRDGSMTQEELLTAVETLSREISQPITILDPQGVVRVDTEDPLDIEQDDSKDPEVAAVLSGRAGSLVRFDVDSKDDVLFTVAPIHIGKDLVGFVRLELSMRLVREASQQFWLRIIGATGLAALVTVIVSLLFARALTQPISQLNRAATAMAKGNLRQRIEISGVTELEQLAKSFNFMAGRIARVMEDQRAFVANAAHELRTPLTTIRLRAEALSDGAKDDPQVATQFLSDIVNESERLSRLVDQLLDLSRIETGLVAPRRELVALDAIARDVVRDLTVRATEGQVELVLDAQAELARVSADADQMRQVLINLIGNALKFTPAGGKIIVRLANIHQPRNEIGDLPAGNWLVTTVSDTGLGIPEEDLPNIFERFYRSDKARARETGGAGLGLAIVKSIIDSHLGRVWVKSEIGKGTQIAFALPILQHTALPI